MKYLKYVTGLERHPYLEKDQFEDSIYYEQYVQSLKLIDGYLSNMTDDSLKCVAFCGERGEGKTSCMTSVREIISQAKKEECPGARLIDKLKLRKIGKYEASLVEIIDPSFFDETHNVLEIIIAHLYNSYNDSKKSDRLAIRHSLLDAFHKVNSSLKTLSEGDSYSLDELHSLSILATSVTLRKQIADLVDVYLQYVEADYLVITIDDIDLDVAQAYKMCEQIRKYLCVPKCIVLISFKLDQLRDAVAQSMWKSMLVKEQNKQFFPYEVVLEMAKKYVNKLIPITGRIEMPKVSDLTDIGVRWKDANGKEQEIESVKQAIVELIYNRTRFLFYNPINRVSPIIPNNLRDIVNLIGLLLSMEFIPDSRDPEKRDQLLLNKHLFKYFFFSVWINRFDEKLQNTLDSLVNFDFGSSFNREVVTLLGSRFEDILEKDYYIGEDSDGESSGDTSESDDTPFNSDLEWSKFLRKVPASPTELIVNSIISGKNFGYNVSLGDVFYIFSLLENETLDEEDVCLIFFLKSLYSIKLYEAYDLITENSDNIWPVEPVTGKGLSIIDHRFDTTNYLQQFIGGSLFTFSPGDLIPEPNGEALDLRVINGKLLNNLISDLKSDYREIEALLKKKAEEISNEEKGKIDSFFEALKVAEFFILTTKCSVKSWNPSKSKLDLIKAIQKMRRNADPFHYGHFHSNTGFYVFDITAPFGNLVNVKYCYKRYEAIDDDFYQFIFESERSLLGEILKRSSDSRRYINHEDDAYWTSMHRLLSDCVIRNAEILSAIRNNLAIRRRSVHNSGWEEFIGFYREIHGSELKTQKSSPSAKPDDIAFNSLLPLHSFLKEIIPLKEGTEDNNQKNVSIEYRGKSIQFLFESIFETKKNDSVAVDSKVQEVSMPTVEELKQEIGRRTLAASVRDALKEIPYFQSYSGEQLKVIIPDPEGDTKYTSNDIEQLLKNWLENEKKTVKNPKELIRQKMFFLKK